MSRPSQLAPQWCAQGRVDRVGRAARRAAAERADTNRGVEGREARGTPAALSIALEGAWRVGDPERVARGTSSAPETLRRGADEVPLCERASARPAVSSTTAEALTPFRSWPGAPRPRYRARSTNALDGRGAISARRSDDR
jgi:hypothetical protein